MQTLIITVGTRQVGWRCADGTVCCFGADGDRNQHPRHTDRLYAELGIQRGCQDGYPWSVQDLGQRYYHRCRHDLDGTFDPVELLLDHEIIEAQYSQGLTDVVLWGTRQPDTTDASYRSRDTHWLAQLMAGKIRQTWPELTVAVFEPVVAATDSTAIRHALEDFLVQHTQGVEEVTLLIQTKGALPAIAHSLDICAAALVRQYPVLQVVPIEPVPLYSGDSQSANRSQHHQVISIGEYFWPIERLRIVAAWQQGNFSEAALWLMAHQDRHRLLYRLAQQLSLAANWQIEALFQPQGLGQWLQAGSLHQVVPATQIEIWRTQVEAIRHSPPAQTWECSFLVYLLLRQGNYTDAFMRFAQTLERLLYLRSQADQWFHADELQGRHPGFKQLIDRWFQSQGTPLPGPHYDQVDRIRNTRNQVVHQAKAMTLDDLCRLWPSTASTTAEALHGAMEHMLHQMYASSSGPSLLHALYDWGLSQLI
ncbi:hypothetical protein XM38_021590 [Halomicronema hongdechloris C2206]|uniref:Uncharacterized protein n=1 Tax=Halomicronema hongdechloris C2206 TaxID=1641165 RepID=A0A1Z3HM63_9CYAN|nr:hypothetical protein [Halomicronema hongdechloris]ASC71207.1 hypothetical protein XM38_021590 [Halomicronema hongdechloris C2206]